MSIPGLSHLLSSTTLRNFSSTPLKNTRHVKHRTCFSLHFSTTRDTPDSMGSEDMDNKVSRATSGLSRWVTDINTSTEMYPIHSYMEKNCSVLHLPVSSIHYCGRACIARNIFTMFWLTHTHALFWGHWCPVFGGFLGFYVLVGSA